MSSRVLFLFSDDRWLPKSVLCLRNYSFNKFLKDLVAGITVGLVALPLAMAFSIASGLTPQAGIYCAIVTGFLISALGGSKTQIGGPTGAFVVVISGIIAAHGVDGLFMCTVMAGVFLVILGATGMGTAVKFIPRPVVIGFTNGIAVLIASTQIKDFFGLHLQKVPGEFWLRIKALAASAPTWSWQATLLASLMSAVVSDRMSDDHHNPNIELIGQGVANVFSPMFGGLPATGAIARTATSIRAGAQSPVAGIIHSLTLLCVLLFAAKYAAFIPMAALAGILMIVAYNMGEWREIPQLLKLTKTDISVWLVTVLLTVFADLTVAVEAGMILAALLFITRVANTTTVSQVTDVYVEDGRIHILQDKDIPYYATIFRIHGPFLFGATDKISAITENMHKLPPVVIIRLRNMTAIDATGLYALEEVAKQLHASRRTLILCGAREQPAQLIHQAEFEEVVGRENICSNVEEALRRAEDAFENIKPLAAKTSG